MDVFRYPTIRNDTIWIVNDIRSADLDILWIGKQYKHAWIYYGIIYVCFKCNLLFRGVSESLFECKNLDIKILSCNKKTSNLLANYGLIIS